MAGNVDIITIKNGDIVDQKTLIPLLPWTMPTCVIEQKNGSYLVGYDDGKIRQWSKL